MTNEPVMVACSGGGSRTMGRSLGGWFSQTPRWLTAGVLGSCGCSRRCAVYGLESYHEDHVCAILGPVMRRERGVCVVLHMGEWEDGWLRLKPVWTRRRRSRSSTRAAPARQPHRTHLRNEVLRAPRPVIWVSRRRKSERWVVVVVVVVVVVIVGDLGWSCVNAVRRFHS